MKLGYLNTRCLASSIRLLLNFLKIDFEDKMYPNHIDNRKEWLDHKNNLGLSFPNLPYLVDGDFQMTEHIPIHEYIAEKFRPELLGRSVEERATVKMLVSVLRGFKWDHIIWGCYGLDSPPKGKEGVLEKLEETLPLFEKYLGMKKFLVGEQITWVDFYFWDMLEWAEWLLEGKMEVQYPSLHRYWSLFAELTGL